MVFLHPMVFFLIMRGPTRGENFVTRKITMGIAEIIAKKRKKKKNLFG